MMATCKVEKSNDDYCLEVKKENVNVVESTEMKKSDTQSAETLLDTMTTTENKESVIKAEGEDIPHESEVRKRLISYSFIHKNHLEPRTTIITVREHAH
jgi:hypothetical protein